MEETTLEDLKKEVGAEDQAEDQAQQETIPDQDIYEEQGELFDDPEGEDEPEEDQDKPDIEPWMQTESQSNGDGDVPVHTHIKIKQKLKGRISDQKDEIATLKAELDALKSGGVPAGPVPGSKIVRPRPEDFQTDEQYEEARTRYEDEIYRDRMQRVSIEEKQRSLAANAKASIDDAVSKHYDRAAKLVEAHNIDPENFRAADNSFRMAIDSVAKGNGDAFADKMIETLGEGSEKVLYHLGVNESARGQFVSKLIEDPTGLKAMAFLGQKKAELTKPNTKTRSRAPKPAAQQRGNTGALSSQVKKLKAAHDKALKSGDLQGCFNIRRKAKAAKMDVSGW